MALLFIILGVVVALAVVVGVTVWYWTCRRPFVKVLAEELHAEVRMDAMTRQTAEAMRNVVRGHSEGWGARPGRRYS
jgi:flagellar basal body-associated protein FliL